jgi:cobalt/nickel transport system permease protein
MDLSLDVHAHLDSPIHRWNPRLKMVGLMAVILAFSALQDLRIIAVMLVFTALLFTCSRLPLRYLLDRLRYPGYFLLVVAVLLPFFSGETALLSLGPLTIYHEGTLALARIAAKFLAILTTGLVLFGTAPFLVNIKALRGLGLPAILTDMALLAYRYLFEIGDDLISMERAMRLRGFQANRINTRAVQSLASLAGSLLVRSYEQSERVYKAMRLRGYGRGAGVLQFAPILWQDVLLLALTLIAAVSLLAAEFIVRGM